MAFMYSLPMTERYSRSASGRAAYMGVFASPAGTTGVLK